MAMVLNPAITGPGRPVISVCIANYNGEQLLAECIDSLLAQQADADIEIIVHDDASTDSSLDVLRTRYPQVKVIPSKRNVGFCIANNRMAAVATGQYLLLLNNDAALFQDAIATLLSAARGQQPEGILTLPQFDWKTGRLVDYGCLLDPFYNPVPNLDPQRHDIAYVIGACLWIPRALWQELGGFPEWFGSIGEDMFLCCAARLRGYPVQVIPASGYRHRQGISFGGNRATDDGLRTTIRRRQLSERNKVTVLVLCTPTPFVWALLPLHLALLALEGLLLALLRMNPRIWHEVYAPALLLSFREATSLRTRRAAIQQTRVASRRNYCRGFCLMPRKLVLLLQHGLPRFGD
jgi:GT2 family glycosyltransferase